jgi:uncharacterized Zn finger protein (UPF0148 family)
MLLVERIKSMYNQINLIQYRGDKVSCPCCDENFNRFQSFGNPIRINAKCPNCGSYNIQDKYNDLVCNECGEEFEAEN